MEKNTYPKKQTDLTYLREIGCGHNAFIIKMLNIFIEEMPVELIRMETAMKNKNWDSFRSVVHKIKPSLVYVGLKGIANDVPILEEYAAKKSHLDAIPSLVNKVKWVCGKAFIELRDELKQFQ